MPVFPVWHTRTGLIADVSEQESVNIVFEARGNDESQNCTYRFLSGQLPAGLTFSNVYTIPGYTNAFCRVSGITSSVDEITTSEFTLRANIGNQFADASFQIRVEGPDIPQFTTSGDVGNVLAGQYIANTAQGYEIGYVDDDPSSQVTIGLSYTSNALPYGVDIVEESGNFYIRGIPVLTTFDSYGNPQIVRPPYQWPRYVEYVANVELSDGLNSVFQTITIGVNARDYWSADSDNYTLAAQPVNSGNRAVLFGNSTVFVRQSDQANVNLIVGDPIEAVGYFPANTVITSVTANVELQGNLYTQVEVSNLAVDTTEADATADILFLKTSFAPTSNDYLSSVTEFEGSIVSGILYTTNVENLAQGSLITTGYTTALPGTGVISSQANVRIGSVNGDNSYGLNNYFGANTPSQLFRATVLDQGHLGVFTNPFPGGQGYAARGYYSADMSNKYEPILLDPSGALQPTVNGNFYAFKFTSYDPNGREVYYRVSAGSLPPGLVLDSVTGFIYGYVVSEFDASYEFSIQAYIPALLGEYISYTNTYRVFVTGRRPSKNEWVTGFQVGTVATGQASELKMLATSNVVESFVYTLDDGTLPPGLRLSETGLIIGKPAFSSFTPAQRTRNYDVVIRATGNDIINPQGGVYNVTFTGRFRITVTNEFDLPYNDIYIQAYPPAETQGIVSGILSDGESMPSELIYRFEDPYYGISDTLFYTSGTGLNVANSQVYFNAMQENHYRRFVTVGPFQTALARNLDETVRYEVVYCPLIDNLENNSNVSVGMSVGWPPNRGGISVVYPNSLDNMQTRIYTQLGRVNRRLPLWMRSRQANGRVLGWTHAWVVCYCQPRASGEIAYRLNQRWGSSLNRINFDWDRYNLDQSLTWNYQFSTTANVDAGNAIANTVTQGSWLPPIDSGLNVTSVDVANNTITVQTPESGYITSLRVGDTISVSNNRIAVNSSNLETTVLYVGSSTGQTAYFVNQGNVVPGNIIYANSYFSNANVYVSANGTPTIGYNTTENTIVVANLAQAGFSNVTSNIYIVNQYVDDDRYNKYLLFPKVNIIN